MGVRDGRGVEVSLAAAPQRIVSLVPSATETLVDLGVGDALVGVTRYCVHPAGVRGGRAVIGGTKDADVDAILALRPDLVVANCEENTREMIDALDAAVPVWAAFPRSVDHALADIAALGALVGRDDAGRAWASRASTARDALRDRLAGRSFRYAWLIWRKPWMAVSDDTFIAAMLAEAGGVNALGHLPGRFPELSSGDLASADPDVVCLSSEPLPFTARHAAELADATGLPRARFRLTDGEYASWHGTRMAAGFAWLAGFVDGLVPPP